MKRTHTRMHALTYRLTLLDNVKGSWNAPYTNRQWNLQAVVTPPNTFRQNPSVLLRKLAYLT